MPFVIQNFEGKFKGRGRFRWEDDVQDAIVFRRASDAYQASAVGKILEVNITLVTAKKPSKTVRPSWDDYFMGLAFLVSRRSHDTQTQHGCVIVDHQHHILGTGYNGFPRDVDDSVLPTTRPEKYDWMIHSEVNAVSNCVGKPDCTSKAYVTGECCNNCLMHLWQNGIEHVVCAKRLGSKLLNEETRKIRTKFLELTGMKIKEVTPDLRWMQNDQITGLAT